MKKHLILLTTLFFTVFLLSAQAPEKFNYQAVARGNNGQPLANQSIGVRIKIHSGSAGGTVVYSETHALSTNQFGLFTLAIGGGTPVTGTVGAIDWSADSYFAETEVDPAGGTSYTSLGAAQLLSVPYALYAKDGGPWARSGNNISNTNTGNVGIGTASPTAHFQVEASGSSTLAKLKRTGTVSGSEMLQIEADSITSASDLISLSVPSSSPATAQFIEFERGGTAVAQINTNGDFITTSEYRRTETTDANLVPIAYGTVSSAGVLLSGTSNVTVVKSSTGTYDVTIAGENYYYTDYTTVVSLASGPGFARASSASNKLRIFTDNTSGVAADYIFNFVVYKK